MEHYKWHQNRECEYFPCHKGVPEDEFNCLFCYCPLYALKDKCGGNFIKKYGVKDCTGCTKPHKEDSYDFVISKISEIIDLGSTFD